MRKDSAALKVAVMPTLDCLPLYVAEHYQLFDTLRGGVRLKFYMAQMDCDTALERGRVEGSITDLVRAKRMEKRGLKLRYAAATNASWQLIANRNARVHQLKQLDDKMLAMTRFSATDLLTDRVIDSVKLDKDRVFKVQINDVSVRLLMLQNNEMDAMWLAEPHATAARILKNNVVYDTRKEDILLGVLAFREKEMQHQERAKQLELLVNAYNQACDSINKYGVRKYLDVIVKRCRVKKNLADSLPDRLRFDHAQGPREKDIKLVEKWLGIK
jgi:NitT/TauT family transport system substrate-binding protein